MKSIGRFTEMRTEGFISYRMVIKYRRVWAIIFVHIKWGRGVSRKTMLSIGGSYRS